MRPLLEVARAGNCLMASAAALVGAAVATGSAPGQGALLAALAVLLVCAGGNAANDYVDRDVDAVNAPHRPIPSGRLSARTALAWAAALFLAGLAAASLVSPLALAVAALAALLLALYARWGKRAGLLGNVTVAGLTGLAIVYGGIASLPGGDLGRVAVLGACAALATLGRELVKAIEDMEGDRAGVARSVPLVAGPERARSLAALSVALAVALGFAPVALGMFSRSYLPAILLADGLFAASVAQLYRGLPWREAAGASQRALKAGMLLALGAFLVGNR